MRYMAPVISRMGMTGLMNRAHVKIVLPFYHIVSDDKCDHVRHLYRFKNIRQFENDLDILLHHFEPVSAASIKSIVGGKKFTKPPMHLSFDDGLREMREIVAPILYARGIPASFYINTDYVGNRDLMFRYKASLLTEKFPEKRNVFMAAVCEEDLRSIPEYTSINFKDFLNEHRPYMNWEEVKELASMGFEVGSHGKSHAYFYRLTEEEQYADAIEPYEIMKHHGVFSEPRIFAFPFTDSGVSKRTIRELLDAGGVEICLGGAGFKGEDEPRHLQRVPMEGYDADAGEVVKAELLYTILRGGMQKHKVKRA